MNKETDLIINVMTKNVSVNTAKCLMEIMANKCFYCNDRHCVQVMRENCAKEILIEQKIITNFF